MYFHSQPMEGRHHAPIISTDYINRLTTIKTEYIRTFSNFNFEWTKTLYQNNFKNIAFFSYFSSAIDMIIQITPKTISYENPRK